MLYRSAIDDPDFELVRACQDLDSDDFEGAFRELYERYKDRVYSIALRVTGTSGDAMDVVQDAFTILFRKIDAFSYQSKFSTWLFRLVVNASVDHVRKSKPRRLEASSIHAISTHAEPTDPGPSPIGDAEAAELGDHIHASLQKVSPKLRAVLVLRYLEGLSYEELAATLEISLGTVKSRLARAHVAIERVLSTSLDAFDLRGEKRASEGGAA